MMKAEVKRYYIVVRGRVQDVGYRKRIESLEKKEISIEFPLPPMFARLETGELGEILRKLDIGNERLQGIEFNTQQIGSNTEGITEALRSVGSKLDALPERIAKAIK